MKRRNITGLLIASILVLAGTHLGSFQAQAAPKDKDDKKVRVEVNKEDKKDKERNDNGNHYGWEIGNGHKEGWSNGNHLGHDHDWDDDDKDDDDVAEGGWVNVVYYCDRGDTTDEWDAVKVWAKALEDGKGNVNSSELHGIPQNYELRFVGDFYYNGRDELHVEVIPTYEEGGWVNVVYYYVNGSKTTEWTNKKFWTDSLEDGKGNVNHSEFPKVPHGYELCKVGDYYYNGEAELRVEVRPIKK